MLIHFKAQTCWRYIHARGNSWGTARGSLKYLGERTYPVRWGLIHKSWGYLVCFFGNTMPRNHSKYHRIIIRNITERCCRVNNSKPLVRGWAGTSVAATQATSHKAPAPLRAHSGINSREPSARFSPHQTITLPCTRWASMKCLEWDKSVKTMWS